MANNHLRLLIQPIILFSETMAILVPTLTVLVCLHVFAINSVVIICGYPLVVMMFHHDFYEALGT